MVSLRPDAGVHWPTAAVGFALLPCLGWSCNEFGVFLAEADRDYRGAAREFEQACARGFEPGCVNYRALAAGATTFPPRTSSPTDMPIVLRGSKGAVAERDFDALIELACRRGWSEWTCPSSVPSGP